MIRAGRRCAVWPLRARARRPRCRGEHQANDAGLGAVTGDQGVDGLGGDVGDGRHTPSDTPSCPQPRPSCAGDHLQGRCRTTVVGPVRALAPEEYQSRVCAWRRAPSQDPRAGYGGDPVRGSLTAPRGRVRGWPDQGAWPEEARTSGTLRPHLNRCTGFGAAFFHYGAAVSR